jgi:hypothetical protein
MVGVELFATEGVMSWDSTDDMMAREEEYLEEFLKTSLKNISEENAKAYLGKYGDAVDVRVQACLSEAEVLLKGSHYGSALTLAATAVELMIRFLLLRPLVQGAFLSDEWGDILASRVAQGRSAEDRALLPAVLKVWGIDITAVKTAFATPAWEFVLTKLWPCRNDFVHKGAQPSKEVAITAIECAKCFRVEIVGKLATKLGFTLETTGKWCEIRGEIRQAEPFKHSSWSQDFTPLDPF